MEENCNVSNDVMEDNDNKNTTLLSVYYFTILLTFIYSKLFSFYLQAAGHSTAAITRVRVSVSSIFRQLGAYYCMDTLSF
jgi:hypothetical protein